MRPCISYLYFMFHCKWVVKVKYFYIQGNLFQKTLGNFLHNFLHVHMVCNEMEHYVVFTYQPFKILTKYVTGHE